MARSFGKGLGEGASLDGFSCDSFVGSSVLLGGAAEGEGVGPDEHISGERASFNQPTNQPSNQPTDQPGKQENKQANNH